MESFTSAQLSIHDKPCGILNVDGFFDDLLGLVPPRHRPRLHPGRQVEALVISDDVDELLDALVARTTIRSRPGRGHSTYAT